MGLNWFFPPHAETAERFALLQFVVVPGRVLVEISFAFCAWRDCSAFRRIPCSPLRSPDAAFGYCDQGDDPPEMQALWGKVRFVPMVAAEPIEADVDFAKPDLVA